jgi:hypothetical protein
MAIAYSHDGPPVSDPSPSFVIALVEQRQKSIGFGAMVPAHGLKPCASEILQVNSNAPMRVAAVHRARRP